MKRKIVCLVCACSVFSLLVGCTSQNQEIVVGELTVFEPAVAIREDVETGETRIMGEAVITGEAVVNEEASNVEIKETENVMTVVPATESTRSEEVLLANTEKMETISGDAGDVSDEAVSQEATSQEAEVTPETIRFGKYRGNVYINTYLNIGCNPPSNWKNASIDNIYARNNIAAGLSDEEYSEFFEKTNVVIDLVSTRNDIPDTMTLNYNRLTGAGLLVDESTYLNVSINSMASQFSNMGFENVTATKSTTTFLGQQRECIRVEGEREGTKVYEVVLYVKKDNHMASITACTWGENTVDSLLSSFYRLR